MPYESVYHEPDIFYRLGGIEFYECYLEGDYNSRMPGCVTLDYEEHEYDFTDNPYDIDLVELAHQLNYTLERYHYGGFVRNSLRSFLCVCIERGIITSDGLDRTKIVKPCHQRRL